MIQAPDSVSKNAVVGMIMHRKSQWARPCWIVFLNHWDITVCWKIRDVYKMIESSIIQNSATQKCKNVSSF
jgi:hypothetical protein